MVVIAIVSILAVSATGFNFNKKTDIEKRNNLLNKITSIIDTEKLNSKAWKWINTSSTNIINPTFSEINVFTWGMDIYYFTWTTIDSNIFTWTTFKLPFFWDTKYNIKSIDYKNIDSSTWTLNNLQIIFDNIWNNIIFSWSDSSGNPQIPIIISITAWYSNEYKTIIFDKRTWKIGF